MRTLLTTVILLSLVAPAPAVSQDESGWIMPRTPWGEPDLQGIWTNATLTRLERPEAFADKEFLTDEEVALLEEEAAREQFTDRAPRAGNPGTYNKVWFDRGTKVAAGGRTSLIIDPADGRIPWTPEGRQHYQRSRARYGKGPYYSVLDMDTGERCLTDGLPMVPTQGYNMNYHILQTPGYVAILHEMYHESRIIPIDGRPHLDSKIPQWLGDARGHWEGDTLVVETTNFADKSHYWWAASWRTSRPTLHLVERFTRVDAETIDYQFTLTDPTSFTKPWTVSIPMTTNQEGRGVTSGQMFEFACHEGNYAVENVLRGARAEEEAAEKAANKDSREE